MDPITSSGTVTVALFAILVIVLFVKGIVIVPNQKAVIVERLGKYRTTLLAGFHVIIPIIDRKAYVRSLKEMVLDVPAQTCITSDNVSVSIDGVIYLQVVDPQMSAYGISDYIQGAVQLAQTSMRSSIGRMALDRTFESREHINREVCTDLNAATVNWGVKILRYEIRDLTPPSSIKKAMEEQVKAEREKRAAILQSEGEKQSAINRAEGQRASAIAISEGEKLARINRAEGEAEQILRIATATAEGLERVKAQLDGDSVAAAQLRLAEAYIAEFGKIAAGSNTMIIPADAASVGNMVSLIAGMLRPGEGLAKAPGGGA